MKDNVKVVGEVTATLFDKNGKVIEQQTFKNLVVTTGLTFLASRAVSDSASLMSHMAIGSGNTSPVAGNTTLETETARVSLTSQTSAGAVITYVAQFGSGVGTGSVEECGLFDASSGGTLLARSTSISLTKGASDTLQITWAITLG